MDPHLRENKAFNVQVPDNVLHYAAGLSDTDGTFLTMSDSSTGTVNGVRISITQAEKGIAALHFMHDHFGGQVALQKPSNEKHQAAYCWHVFGKDALDFARCIADKMYVKRREALVLVEFPLQNVHIVPIKATHAATGEVKVFDTQKDAKTFFDRKVTISLSDDKVVKLGDWSLEKTLKAADIAAIKKQRLTIKETLVRLKTEPHDLIPVTERPPHAYFAGIVDGDGSLDTDGKSSQTHNVTQRDRPLLDMMERIYRGHVTFKGEKRKWSWDIELFADEFLDHIHPYLVGKKKQADLIKDMKPGEGFAVHAKLRELKGNYGGSTTIIDATNAGAGPSTAYKRDAKRLPKGVHAVELKDGTNYRVLIKKGGEDFHLGCFATVEAAEAKYKACKKLIDDEKRGGPAVDMSAFTPVKHVQPEVPQAFYDERPKGIYLTASNTFQVRKNRVDLGTYKTYYEAKRVRAAG
jgi:hypothetical protein